MDGLTDLPAAYVSIRGGGLVRYLLTEGLSVLVLGAGCVHGVGNAVLLGLAEVIDQQVAGDGGHPGDVPHTGEL